MNRELYDIQTKINEYKKENPNSSVGELSDTYHTFNDLYKHRTLLTALAFLKIPYAWKSKTHNDGSMYDGMFIVGAPTTYGMITYHYDLEYWDLFKIPELPKAPKFTGYSDADVLDRIEAFVRESVCGRLVNMNNYNKIMEIVTKEILPTFEDNPIKAAAFMDAYDR